MEKTRHFFKVLIPGFHQRLNLPPTVSMELETQKPRRATLQSSKGTWEITMSKNCESNNLLCFDEGWSEFVESHALHLGDFLVFERTKNLHFDVLVFDSTACEKRFHVEPKTTKKRKDGNSNSEEALNPEKRIRGGGDESPYFVKKMSPSFATNGARVNIPTEFMRSNGLGQKSRVRLRDPNSGREWSVDLSTETNGDEGFRNRMCGDGWHHFYVSNKLNNGDTCVFKLRRHLLTSASIFFDVYFNVRAPT